MTIRRKFWGGMCGLAALLSLAGCSGGGGGGTRPPLEPVNGQFGPLTFTASAPQSVYAPGMPVPVTLTIRNTSTSPSFIQYDGRTPYELQVSQGNRVVRQISPVLSSRAKSADATLGAGQSLQTTLTWDGKGDSGNIAVAGVYALKAWFNANTVSGRTVSSPSGQTAAKPVFVTLQ